MGFHFEMPHFLPGREDILKEMLPDILRVLEEVRLPDEPDRIVVETGEDIGLIRRDKDQRDFLINLP